MNNEQLEWHAGEENDPEFVETMDEDDDSARELIGDLVTAD